MTQSATLTSCVLGALLVLALQGCESDEALMAQARAIGTKGRPLVAIELLREVERRAPSTPLAATATTMRADLLAKHALSLQDLARRDRLMKIALNLAPNSGVVWANACVALADAENFEQLRGCLDKLNTKSNVPQATRAKAKTVIDAHDQEVERGRLIASDNEQDWRTLVASHSKSAEAELAAEKLRDLESICRDAARLDPSPGIDAMLKLAQSAHDIGGSRQELEIIMNVAEGLSSLAKAVKGEAGRHAVLPGEERARQLLGQDYVTLMLAFSGWLNAINESGGSFEARAALRELAGPLREEMSLHTTERTAVCLGLNTDFQSPPPTNSNLRRWAEAIQALDSLGK